MKVMELKLISKKQLNIIRWHLSFAHAEMLYNRDCIEQNKEEAASYL